MNCKECEILITRKVAGEATSAEEAALELHLKDCAPCCLEYAELTGAKVLLLKDSGCAEYPGMVSTVFESIEREESRYRRGFFPRLVLRSAFAVAAVLAVVFGYDAVYSVINVSDYTKILDFAKYSFSGGSEPVVKAALQHQQADELSNDSIDYTAVASLENALYSIDKHDNVRMIAILKDIIRRKSEGSLSGGAVKFFNNIFGSGVVVEAACNNVRRVQDEILTAVECEKTQNYDDAVRIYSGISTKPGIDAYTASLSAFLAERAKESKLAYQRSANLKGDQKLKALVKSLDYLEVVKTAGKGGTKTRDGRFIVGVSLSKSGYGLESALVFNELKNENVKKNDKKNDKKFEAAVKMNLGVAAEKSGVRSVAAGCFKEVNSSGITSPVDISAYGNYVRYVLEPWSRPPNIVNAGSARVQLGGKEMIRVQPHGAKWAVGEDFAAVNMWKTYDTFSFDVYNPGKKVLIFDFRVRALPDAGKGKIFLYTAGVRSGYSSVAIDLRGATSLTGESYRWDRNVHEWYFTQNKFSITPEVFYVNNFRLEKSQPAAVMAGATGG